MKNNILAWLWYIACVIGASVSYYCILKLVGEYMLPETSVVWIGIPALYLSIYVNGKPEKIQKQMIRGAAWFPLIPAFILYLISYVFVEEPSVIFMGFLVIALCLSIPMFLLYGIIFFHETWKRKLRWLAYVGILALSLGLTGCKKEHSVETYDYVLALGVEPLKSGFLYHYSIADVSKVSSDSGIKVPSKTSIIHAKNFQEGKRVWQEQHGKEPNFGHLKVVVLRKLDRRVLKQLQKEKELSKSVYVTTTKKSLAKLFQIEEKLPISFGEYMEQVIEKSNRVKNPKRCQLSSLTQDK